MINSIHQSLAAKMQSLKTCFQMYTALYNKFKTTSRAAQINIWYKFRDSKINLNGHNADGLFVLQTAVMESAAPYKATFKQTALDICKEQYSNLARISSSNSGSSLCVCSPNIGSRYFCL
ncbi:hypothetical protein PSTT_12406 [Puccinia striiformis]|uniref:Uncharacterized protein n=1 Tax=Puccinia striiformis TaxID=27350 RepID=A0A2S4UW81_9BASI|nr:hypothetical protein PSTT_12406 [Puccinia striiformis]